MIKKLEEKYPLIGLGKDSITINSTDKEFVQAFNQGRLKGYDMYSRKKNDLQYFYSAEVALGYYLGASCDIVQAYGGQIKSHLKAMNWLVKAPGVLKREAESLEYLARSGEVLMMPTKVEKFEKERLNIKKDGDLIDYAEKRSNFTNEIIRLENLGYEGLAKKINTNILIFNRIEEMFKESTESKAFLMGNLDNMLKICKRQNKGDAQFPYAKNFIENIVPKEYKPLFDDASFNSSEIKTGIF